MQVMAYHHRHFPRSGIPLSETLEAWVLVFSIGLSIWLAHTNIIALLAAGVSNFESVGSFIEGLFFSSMLTTAPAVIALFESATYVPAWKLSLFGGAGAVCGDMLIFRFVQSKLVEHILTAALHPRVVHLGRRIASGPLWFLGPVLGTIVIASPLPDELGLLMMGLSHLRLVQFIPIAFAANAAGIYLIALAAQAAS